MTRTKWYTKDLDSRPDHLGIHQLDPGDRFELYGEFHTFESRERSKSGWWVHTAEKSYPTHVSRGLRVRKL